MLGNSNRVTPLQEINFCTFFFLHWRPGSSTDVKKRTRRTTDVYHESSKDSEQAPPNSTLFETIRIFIWAP
ncbi:hypothetical protein CC2G_013986 [Coprinopsis cinerea AmutBmut pab1-1]|nr:hypothetical protein CC2G_013986 [Coprinopsis cinerea AmutBmut pab1-1]